MIRHRSQSPKWRLKWFGHLKAHERPGKVEAIPFDKTRMVSRKLGKGSRLLVTLNVNKNRNAQINYGTGKDVSDEDIGDAKEPLQIEWQNDSFVRIPIWKGA
jgi:hypothetical protein